MAYVLEYLMQLFLYTALGELSCGSVDGELSRYIKCSVGLDCLAVGSYCCRSKRRSNNFFIVVNILVNKL